MRKSSEITICHVSEQNLNLPQESYSRWFPCKINHGRKSRNEMRDPRIFYFRSSKDL